MGRLMTRTIGIALIVAGLAGLAFAVGGLFVLLRVEKNVLSVAQEQVSLVDQALSATSDGLDIAEASLKQAVGTIKTLEGTVSGVGDTVGSSVPAMDSISALVGVQLPATIETTQQTLESVASSAQTIDDLLTVMSATRFLGVSDYNPEVSLSQGLRDVGTSLDGIPESLLLTREQLLATSRSLAGVGVSLDGISADIGQIATSVGQAQSVLEQYKDVIGQLQSSVSWIRRVLPSAVYWLRFGMSLLLVWLGVAQFALITQGWELVGRSRYAAVAEEPAQAP